MPRVEGKSFQEALDESPEAEVLQGDSYWSKNQQDSTIGCLKVLEAAESFEQARIRT